MAKPTPAAHPDDILVWPDDYYVYREELNGKEPEGRSDDYRVLHFDTTSWYDFIVEHELF